MARAILLNNIRKSMKDGHIQAYFIPSHDRFQGEYLCAADERLAQVSGFTGSFGYALITEQAASIYVDGRYIVQVRKEADVAFEARHFELQPIDSWAQQHIPIHGIVGMDAWLTSKAQYDLWRARFAKLGFSVKILDDNLVDLHWNKRPTYPQNPAWIMPDSHAGCSAQDKLSILRENLSKQKIDAVYLSLPESVNWLFNLRGGDLDYTPVLFASALITQDAAYIYAASKSLGEDVQKYLAALGVICQDEEHSISHLTSLSLSKIQIDPNSCPMAIYQSMEKSGFAIYPASDPCLLPKACKNETEVSGMRSCHIRDGVAMVNFLSWLDLHVLPRARAGNPITEIEAMQYLQQARRDQQGYIGDSFNYIPAAGDHAAMCHYHALPGSVVPIQENTVFLIDSGGQYRDGTTDITRSISVGQVGDDVCRSYTLALKGLIALSSIVFPKGTVGNRLDVLARQALWLQGMDYDHGTGHGLGHCLGVHEGPQNISKRSVEQALMPGMVLSNEPGFYVEGSYGLRIENLLVVQPHGIFPNFLCFETLTFVPLDQKMIKLDLLSEEERKWIDLYHQQVWDKLHFLLDPMTKNWLYKNTQALS